MALDRVFTLYPSLTASIAGTNAVRLWAQREPRSRVVATGPSGLYDFSQSVARETAVFRIRWRAGVTLRSVLNDDEGNVWFLESLGEVGRRRFIDLACTTYDGVAAGATGAGRWPFLTTPYTAQSNWGVVDSDNEPVQNVTILQLLPPESPPSDDLVLESGFRLGLPTDTNREGWVGLRFRVVNAGYTGNFPVAYNTISDEEVASTNTTHVQVLTEDGYIGRMGLVGNHLTLPHETIQSDDGWIPIGEDTHSPGCIVTFDGVVPPVLGVGSSIRVLSTQELAD